jgi:hypothetical protein
VLSFGFLNRKISTNTRSQLLKPQSPGVMPRAGGASSTPRHRD